jgi:hypothetical protein
VQTDIDPRAILEHELHDCWPDLLGQYVQRLDAGQFDDVARDLAHHARRAFWGDLLYPLGILAVALTVLILYSARIPEMIALAVGFHIWALFLFGRAVRRRTRVLEITGLLVEMLHAEGAPSRADRSMTAPL